MTVNGSISSVNGFRVAGVHAGLKAEGQLDVALFVSDRDCATAGVFTTNTVKAACVTVDMEHLDAARDRVRAVAINTKCANACTGTLGEANAHETAQFVA
ncbi:MAG: bifunctional ornithine acetyltransferase/N-acetylglutamate synthase, partial [Chloroflexota bacterium]